MEAVRAIQVSLGEIAPSNVVEVHTIRARIMGRVSSTGAVSAIRGSDKETVLVSVLAGPVMSAMGEESATASVVAAAALDIGDRTAPWTALGVCRASWMVSLYYYMYARGMESVMRRLSAFATKLGVEQPVLQGPSTGLGILLLAHLEPSFSALHFMV
jgi:hypothetical protein